MSNCYNNYYSTNNRTNKNNIANLFQKDNEEIPIINILSNSCIASLKKNVNKIKSNIDKKEKLKKFGNIFKKQNGGTKSKSKSGTKNTSYEKIKEKIKNTEIKTIIENIDYYTKFTFLQSMHY